MLMVGYNEPARWADVASKMTYGRMALVLASCLNGLAISYAGLRVQQLVTATTFMVCVRPSTCTHAQSHL